MSYNWDLEDKYTKVVEYEQNDKYIKLMFIVLSIPFLLINISPLFNFIPLNRLFIESGLIYAVRTEIWWSIFSYLPFMLIVLVVHEILHYAAGKYYEKRPRFILGKGKRSYFPAVILDDNEVERDKKLVIIILPFILISSILFLLLITTSGFTSYLLFYGLWINTVGSCADIYNFIKIIRMPSDAIIRDWYEIDHKKFGIIPVVIKDEVTTKYAVTKEDN